MTNLVRQQRDTFSNLLDYLWQIENPYLEVHLGDEEDIALNPDEELQVFWGEQEIVEEGTGTTIPIDDPVREPPEAEAHPPGPPLDPGGPNRGGIKVSEAVPDYRRLGVFLLNAPEEIIKHTLSNTTQFARWPQNDKLKKMFKTPFPACNVPQWNEDVATDTVYLDTPAFGGGEHMA